MEHSSNLLLSTLEARYDRKWHYPIVPRGILNRIFTL